MAEYFAMSAIMDSINEKVHELLIERQLDDTVENAGPIFDEVVKQVTQSIRAKDIELHCFKIDELRQLIEYYQRIKQRLDEQQKKLDEYISFIQKYYPEFKK